INDVAWGAELPVLALNAHALEEVFEGVAKFLTVGVLEAVHLCEEHRKDAPVSKFQESVAEDVPKQAGQVRRFLWITEGLDAFRKERDAFISGDGLRQKIAPAVFRQLSSEEGTFAPELYGLLIEVVHELVDQCERDEFDLVGGQRELADEH